MNLSIDITGKLSKGLVELYGKINKHSQALNINYLVVGAMARDLILYHGFEAEIERGTKDVDFGINISSWEEFTKLQSHLEEDGFKISKDQAHRFFYTDKDGLPWEVDIIPFGEIADSENNIYWPPNEDFVMNVLGFTEAFENAISVKICDSPEIQIPVASPAGVSLLKLIAWNDRENPEFREKDASDFLYLIDTYNKIPEIRECLYEQEFMETQDWDETKASAMKLGRDVSKITDENTKSFLEENFFNDKSKNEKFIRDLEKNSRKNLEQCSELLSIFLSEF